MTLPLPSIATIKASAIRAEAYRDALQGRIEANDAKIKELQNEEELLELVANLIRTLVDAEVTSGVDAVQKLQTEGLKDIFFDQNLEVKAEVEQSRGKVSVNLLTVENRSDGSQVEGNPETSFGGSVSTIQSILLRVTVMVRRDMRPLLLLDETLAAVADRYVDRAANFLSILADRLGIDILMISHDDALVNAANRAYRIKKVKDQAKFEEIQR
jgi:hypothetical protein